MRASAGHDEPPVGQARQEVVAAALAAVRALDAAVIDDDELLRAAGLSHDEVLEHFVDVEHLFHEAVITDMERISTAGAEVARDALLGDGDDLLAQIGAALAMLMSTQRAKWRLRRIAAYGAATRRPELWSRVRAAEARVNDTIAQVIASGQATGLVRRDLDAAAVAILIEALVYGRTLVEMNPDRVSDDDWRAVVDYVIESLAVRRVGDA